MTRIRLLAYTILDGTLIPIDRVADRKPYYSGKHRRHGVNVQVIADPAGRLTWAALPGSNHDLTAARTHAIIDAPTRANVKTFTDKAYQGARGSIRTPFNAAATGRNSPPGRRRSTELTRDPRYRRTRQRHPQNLESPDKTTLQPAPGHHDRAGHPRPAPRREPGLHRMKRLDVRRAPDPPPPRSGWGRFNHPGMTLSRRCPQPGFNLDGVLGRVPSIDLLVRFLRRRESHDRIGFCRRGVREFSMRQLQLFTSAQLAQMRDRTASRSYSPAGEEFRREHERHRAWGLARRHAERMRRLHGHRPTAAAPSGSDPARGDPPPARPGADTPSLSRGAPAGRRVPPEAAPTAHDARTADKDPHVQPGRVQPGRVQPETAGVREPRPPRRRPAPVEPPSLAIPSTVRTEPSPAVGRRPRWRPVSGPLERAGPGPRETATRKQPPRPVSARPGRIPSRPGCGEIAPRASGKPPPTNLFRTAPGAG